MAGMTGSERHICRTAVLGNMRPPALTISATGNAMANMGRTNRRATDGLRQRCCKRRSATAVWRRIRAMAIMDFADWRLSRKHLPGSVKGRHGVFAVNQLPTVSQPQRQP